MRTRYARKTLMLIAAGATLLQLGTCVAATTQLVLEQSASAVISALATQLATQITGQITGATDPSSPGG